LAIIYVTKVRRWRTVAISQEFAMPIKPRYSYDATDVAVDAVQPHGAVVTFLTEGERDLSLVLSRELLVRLRSQIDAALTPKVAPAPTPE